MRDLETEKLRLEAIFNCQVDDDFIKIKCCYCKNTTDTTRCKNCFYINNIEKYNIPSEPFHWSKSQIELMEIRCGLLDKENSIYWKALK